MQDAANFIPNGGEMITPEPEPSSSGGGSGGLVDVAMLVSIILLASSLAIATGVFLYGNLVDKQLVEKKQTLARARARVDKHTIESLKLLSLRLTVGRDLLNKHFAASEIFRALENITLKSVQFEDFKFDALSEDTMRISLKGKALTVNAVAAQSKAFSQNTDKFRNVIFSDLGFEKDGTVSFNVTADVDKDFVNFTNLVLKNVNESQQQNTAKPNDSNQDNVSGDNFQSQSAVDSVLDNTNTINQDSQSANQQQTDEFGNLIN